MKSLATSIAALAVGLLFLASGGASAHETARLKDAHINFRTEGRRKKSTTRVIIQVYSSDGSVAAKNDPVQTYGVFRHFSKNGPIDLVVDTSKAKYDIKGGYHIIRIEPAGKENWTFSYVLTLDFDDGKQLVYSRSNQTVTQDDPAVRGDNL